MKKTINSKHSRSVFIFALLSLFMCMAAGNASAAERNPVVKIDNTSYTSSGTEVTLRLWMFNWKKTTITTKDYNARLTSSSCHPKFFVKEFSYFLMPCHQHGLGVNLLVQR